MNKFKKFFVPLLMFVVLTNCGDGSFDYDVTDAQRGPDFLQTSYNVSVPAEGVTLEVPIQFASLSPSARDFNLEVVSNTGEDSEFSLVSATIPANEVRGVAVISFDFDDITGDDGDLKVVTLRMANPDGAPSNEVTITYFREVICNDVLVNIVPDDYPGETSWEITSQEDGSTVASGTTGEVTVNLADGCYTFTIFDAFGDGICCAYGNGSYSVTCSIITHASGAEFGGSESTDFCVNP